MGGWHWGYPLIPMTIVAVKHVVLMVVTITGMGDSPRYIRYMDMSTGRNMFLVSLSLQSKNMEYATDAVFPEGYLLGTTPVHNQTPFFVDPSSAGLDCLPKCDFLGCFWDFFQLDSTGPPGSLFKFWMCCEDGEFAVISIDEMPQFTDFKTMFLQDCMF